MASGVEKRVAAQPQKAAAVTDDHVTVEPTEEDYEKARTVGIGNEPELPAGKVENGAVARAAVREH